MGAAVKPSRALQMATYVEASRAAAAWARRKKAELDARTREYHERQADLDDSSAFYPLLPLYLTLFALVLFGLIWSAYFLSH